MDGILSRARPSRLVRPRQMAAWAMVRVLGMSLPKAGLVLGRDHTTILHAVRCVDARLDSDGAEVAWCIVAIAAAASGRPAEA